MLCASLAAVIWPRGTRITHCKLARAAYAARLAAVFPVLAQATVCAPSRTACVTAVVIPVSLNEPVGLQPWCLSRKANNPQYCADRGASYTGVLPSASVTEDTPS